MNNREIDKLIAEKIMKVPCFLSQFGHGEVLWAEFEGQDSVVFHPTSNMRDAWMVVEKLGEVNIDFANDLTEVWIYTEGPTLIGHHEDKSAPMAICLAALKSVGIEVQP
jgi:hypothetical protein